MIRGLSAGQRSALIVSECQNGITNLAFVATPLSEQVASRGVVAKIAGLCQTFRAARLPVVHCLISLPADPDAWLVNCLLAARLAKERLLVTGTPAAAVHDDLPLIGSDIVLERHHGMGPFSGTMLDATLRRHRVETVVLSGVSTNIALANAAAEAVGLGYNVVLAEDCTAGVTPETHRMQVTMHLPLMATISDSASIRATVAEGARRKLDTGPGLHE